MLRNEDLISCSVRSHTLFCQPAVINSLREHEKCRLCGEPTEQSGDDELCDNCFSRNDL